MANTYFKFKQFTINQQGAAMKVGTDSVILGAYTTTSDTKKILDIGCGSALLALMMAQKSEAMIDAVEIDLLSYQQAIQNINDSKWSHRIACFNKSIQDYTSGGKTGSYGLIISNPPYFVQSLKAKDKSRSNARHTDLLSFEDLLLSVATLLADDGVFSVIIPYDSKNNFIEIATDHKLYVSAVLNIFPNYSLPAKRIVLQFKKEQPTSIREDNLTIETDKRHHYTEEYIQLTKDFYLNF